MGASDKIVSFDLGLRDCMYRILRDWGTHKEIIFVLVESFDIIPYIDTSPSQHVLEILSELPEWYDKWTTLSVYREDGEVKARKDAFKPLHLEEGQILGTYPMYDYLGLEVLQTYSYRVECVMLEGKRCFLKLAHNEDDLRSLALEIWVYHSLMQKESDVIPKFIGYACDGSVDRVVGFFYEEIAGEYPIYSQLKQCQVALGKLHDLEILHGDISRFNMIFAKNGQGVKFIDFERASVEPESVELEWEKRKSDEKSALTDFFVLEIYDEDNDVYEPPLVARHRNLDAGLGLVMPCYLGMSNQ